MSVYFVLKLRIFVMLGNIDVYYFIWKCVMMGNTSDFLF